MEQERACSCTPCAPIDHSQMALKGLLGLGLSLLLLLQGAFSVDYDSALTKSILYFEAQRSGKLPSNQRVKWRGDSALKDGSDVGVDLEGGYYDAGDNVKFGFPHAFTVTMLSWSAIDFQAELADKNQLDHALAAIRWGTDYLIKAHPEANVLYGQVGDGDADHACWERPEDMTTPRTSYKIDQQNPGSDLAGETAAAFAAASIAFNKSDSNYSSQLLYHAKQLFDFASSHPGVYQNSIPQAHFYSSSGFEDEILWAAAWLYRATNDKTYLDYLNNPVNTGGTRSMFSWDDKYAGAQILITNLQMEGKLQLRDGMWGDYKNQGQQFICNVIQKGSNNVKTTSAGALWWDTFNNLQYTTSALFLVLSHSHSLTFSYSTLDCPGGSLYPYELILFARSQVDYILGQNPRGMSYMVGYGSYFPQQVHHRGASIPSIYEHNETETCQQGFNKWYYSQGANPNVLDGAIVGGPDQSDNYGDSRTNFQQAEAATANNAPIVGVLALLASY